MNKDNKELIKQLEGVGFAELQKNYLELRLPSGELANFYKNNNVFWITDNVKTEIQNPTFPQILAAIKEHTGVDLTKKTKREEIEELKKRLKVLDEKTEDSGVVFEAKLKGYFMSIVETVQEQATKIENLEDAIESQNEAIEANKDDAHRANDRLTMVLRRLKVLGVWKDEEAEQAEEKKAFKVGDRVVKKGDSNNFCDGSILKVIGLSFNNSCLCKSTQGADIMNFVPSDGLEHAPKESPKQFAKIINEDTRYPLQEGQIVEVVSESNIGATVKRTDKNLSYIYKYSDLEFIKEVSEESPKEKALEFGDPLECLVSKLRLKIGQKVIFLRVEDKTQITKDMRYVISTEGGLTYALRPNEVKAL